MKVYMLYYPAGHPGAHRRERRKIDREWRYVDVDDEPAFLVGGGSSSPSIPRVYGSREQAVAMINRHFPGTLMKEIEL